MKTNEEKIQLLYEVFSPSAPIENTELFIGRRTQIARVRDIIEERGHHGVIYGGRGVGKTSLANILSMIFENISIAKVTCNRTDNFVTIWQKALKKIRFVAQNQPVGFNTKPENSIIELYLPDVESPDASDVEAIFENIPDNILFIFDEFDSISDEETKIKMADTIKVLSDNNPHITIIIIGIADSVTKLIGEHPSLERCVRQIEMPLMNLEEIAEIIYNSLDILQLKAEADFISKTVEYASGFPHYVHLLCKFAAKRAISSNSPIITGEHLNVAIKYSIEDSNHSIKSSFAAAVKSARRQNQFQDVLFSCALSKVDSENSFGTSDILREYNRITKQNAERESIAYNLGMLCKEERGFILTKVGTAKKYRFRFTNPVMKAFVKLNIHNTIIG